MVYVLLDGQHRTVCGPTVKAEAWPLWTPFHVLMWLRNNATKRRDIKGKDSPFHKAEVIWVTKQENPKLTKDALHKALLADINNTWAAKIKPDMVIRYLQVRERIHVDVLKWCENACESVGDYFISMTLLTDFGKFNKKEKKFSAVAQLAMIQEAIFYGFREASTHWNQSSVNIRQLRLFFNFDFFPTQEQLKTLMASAHDADEFLKSHGIDVVSIDQQQQLENLAANAKVAPGQLVLHKGSVTFENGISSAPNINQQTNENVVTQEVETPQNPSKPGASNKQNPISVEDFDAGSEPSTQSNLGIFAVSDTDTKETINAKLLELKEHLKAIRNQRLDALKNGFGRALAKLENELRQLKQAEQALMDHLEKLSKVPNPIEQLRDWKLELESLMEEETRLKNLVEKKEKDWENLINSDAVLEDKDLREVDFIQLKKKEHLEVSGRIHNLVNYIATAQDKIQNDPTLKAIQVDLSAQGWSQHLKNRKIVSSSDWIWGLEIPFQHEDEKGHISYMVDKKTFTPYFALESITNFSEHALKAFFIEMMNAAVSEEGFPQIVEFPKWAVSCAGNLTIQKGWKTNNKTEQDSLASPSATKRAAETSPTSSENDDTGRMKTKRDTKRQQQQAIGATNENSPKTNKGKKKDAS